MALSIKGNLIFLGAKKYDFVNQSGEEIQGITITLYDRDGDSDNKNLIGGEVTTYNQPLENWGIYRDLRPLTEVEVSLVPSGKKLRLISVKPLRNTFEDAEDNFS